MTGEQYINEVKLRLGRSLANRYFSDLDILSAVNQSRRAVQFATMHILKDYYTTAREIPLIDQQLDFYYDNVLTFDNKPVRVFKIQMPDNFADLLEGWLFFRETNPEEYIECLQTRIVSKKEFVLTIKHLYNTAVYQNPLCHIEHRITDGLYYLYLAISDDLYTHAGFLDTATLRVYYLYLVDALGQSSTVTAFEHWVAPIENDPQLPPQVEEMVILQTLVILLSMTDKAHELERLKDELNIYYQILEGNHQIKQVVSETIPSKMSIQDSSIYLGNTIGEGNVQKVS